MELLGHAGLDTIRAYFQPTERDKTKALDRLIVEEYQAADQLLSPPRSMYWIFSVCLCWTRTRGAVWGTDCGNPPTMRSGPAACVRRGPSACQPIPVFLEQVGQAFQPCARSTFSAMAICCDRVAWLAVAA